MIAIPLVFFLFKIAFTLWGPFWFPMYPRILFYFREEWQTHSQHNSKWRKTQVRALRSGLRQGCSGSPTTTSWYSVRRTNQSNKAKYITGPQIGKIKVKIFLSVGDTISHTKDSEYSTRKLLETIDNFSKMPGYKTHVDNDHRYPPIYNSINDNKISCNKSNQGDERPLQW